MALYKSQVEFHAVSGLPEDDVVNTWHFEDAGDSSEETAAHAINGVLASMYTRVDPDVGNSFAEFISSSISRVNRPTVTTYVVDKATGLATSEPYEDTFLALPNPIGAGPLPREVALCLSLSASASEYAEDLADGPDAGLERDRPASRHRGRIYLGPLSQAALTAGTDSRPGNAVIEAALAMGEYLLSPPAPLTAQEVVPVVYSRKQRSTTQVSGFWVDNEWDTQRRRGLKRTTRVTVGTI